MTHDLLTTFREFLNYLTELDSENSARYLDKDVTFELVPEHATIHGKEQVVKNVKEFMDWVQQGHSKIVNSAVNGNQLWLERIDAWKINNTWVELPIASVVTFNEEHKIISWREYHTLEYRKQFEQAPETGFGPLEA